MNRRGKRQLKTGPHLWGARRREVGMSLRELEAATGIPRGVLSLLENRPSAGDLARIMEALEERAAANKEGGSPASPT